MIDLTGLFNFTPLHTIFIDFESFYSAEYTLRKLSTEGYIRDQRFECLGAGVNDGDETVWMEEPEFRSWAKTVPWERCALGAHHTHFDGLIAAHHYGIIPGFYFDTMSMGRALHGTGNISLEKLMPKYGVGFKGHEVENAKGKHRKDFTDEQFAAYGRYCIGDTNGAKDIFWKMIDNGFPESELWVIDATIKAFTDPQFALDEKLLTQYLVDERKRKKELLERLTDGDTKKLRSVLMSNEKLAKLLISLGEDPPRKISPTTKKETWAFAKSDPGMQDMLEHHDDTIRWVAEARVATKSTLNETRTERFLKAGSNNRKMPVYLRYYGAHTGRDSGADGMNWQNLERTDKNKPERGAIRRAVIAPAGKKIVVADSAQIEARTGAWLADHEELMEAFRQDRDVYSEFASVIYNRKVDRKKNKDDFLPGFVAKCSVLGLSFSMGWRTFAATLLRGMLGGPSVQFTMKEAEGLGVDVDDFTRGEWGEKKRKRVENMPSRISMDERIVHCAVAEKIVQTYRAANEPITQLWKTMDSVISAMLDGDQCTFGPGECLQTERHAIVLPNGMKLLYPGLEYKEPVDEEKRGHYSYLGEHKQRKKLYGGSLTENVVQALARIVVFDQAMYFQGQYGYRVATRTHDELVYVVDEVEAPRVKSLLLETMKTPPIWAAGLPLNAEAGVGQSYGECK